MANISEIGNGIGWLYKTNASGSEILAVELNTKQGVRAMQQHGVTNAPIVGWRSSYGTININACNSLGGITSVTIGGQNQIGATVPCTSAVPADLAQDLANAINSWTAPGNPYTAAAVGSLVYIYSAPKYGSVTNGFTITVAVSDPSILFTTTNFADGSSESGSYDSVLGYRFWLNTTLPALPVSIAGATDITVYMTQRGMQVGIPQSSEQINNDTINNIVRGSSFTIVNVDTQGFAATDTLAQIDATGFVEGDIIFIRQANPARVVTVESLTVPSSALTPNIQLTNDASFITDPYNTLMLQLKYTTTDTLIWIEVSRSAPIASTFIVTTLSAFNSLVLTSTLTPNAVYLISDLGNNGTFVSTYSTYYANTLGNMLRYVPDNYVACWQPGMAAPAVGARYRYYQRVYESLTGAVGVNPDIDPVNWQVELYGGLYYNLEIHEVVLNFNVGFGINTLWPIISERDNYSNEIKQSYNHRLSSATNAFEVFSWQSSSTPMLQVTGNYVSDSIFDCANSNSQVIRNSITNGSTFNGNVIPAGGAVTANNLSQGSITGNYARIISGNVVTCAGDISNNGGLGAVMLSILSNNVNGGSIQNCSTPTALGGTLTQNTVNKGQISNCSINSGCGIRYNVINGEYSALATCSLSASSFIDSCSLSGYSPVQITHVNGGILGGIIFNNAQAIIDVLSAWATGGSINNSVVNWSNAASLIGDWDISNSNINLDGAVDATQINKIQSYLATTPWNQTATVIGGSSSNYIALLDLDDPAIFNAGTNTLTIPTQYSSIAGIIQLTSTSNRTIASIAGLGYTWTYKFIVEGTCVNTFQFNYTTEATAVANNILGTTNRTISVGSSTAVSSELYIIRDVGGNFNVMQNFVSYL